MEEGFGFDEGFWIDGLWLSWEVCVSLGGLFVMGMFLMLNVVIEFSEGLLLVFCIVVLFFFVCVDVLVKLVDEW